jgi:hypothetical protein
MGVIINTAYRVQADLLESESNIKIENGTLHVFDNELKVHLNNEIKNIPTSKYKVYTALLTQSGGDNIQVINWDDDPNTLTIGVTYTITENDNNTDFISVGSPNNNVGTSFVATSTIVNWPVGPSIGNNQVSYNTGAPVVTVLENTIGNIWFTYTGVGEYSINSNALFTINKTTQFLNSIPVEQGCLSANNYTDENLIYLNSQNGGFDRVDGYFSNTPIEIRVYN